ncbi:hypothetical protein C9374_001504 [Naegleria lovaniensis]|uniref:RRM domain-containing protein n=1 Tax=Naegleria lovaniensis TaxID=51637 RepID=A0AA88GQT6_NAELO|nr:uncharacterized protein C9374_001504 [Naegleria lovaniensis]KAG2387172.1 hypothetical protein C9374_001504 [Naegleria lovaniensis]
MMDLNSTLLPRSQSLRQSSRFLSSSTDDGPHERCSVSTVLTTANGIMTNAINEQPIMMIQPSQPSQILPSSVMMGVATKSHSFHTGSDVMSESCSSSLSSSSSSSCSDWFFPLSQTSVISNQLLFSSTLPQSQQHVNISNNTSIHLNPSLVDDHAIISNIVESFHYCIIIEFEFSYPKLARQQLKRSVDRSAAGNGFSSSSWLFGDNSIMSFDEVPSSSFPSGVKSVVYHIVKCDNAPTALTTTSHRKDVMMDASDNKWLNIGKSKTSNHFNHDHNDHNNHSIQSPHTSQKGIIINLEEYDPSSTEILQCGHYTPYPVHFVSNFCELLQLLDESIEHETLSTTVTSTSQEELLSSSSAPKRRDILIPSKLHSCFLSPVVVHSTLDHHSQQLQYHSVVQSNIPQVIQELAQRHCIHIDSLFERPFFSFIENSYPTSSATTTSTDTTTSTSTTTTTPTGNKYLKTTSSSFKTNTNIPSFFQSNFTMIKNCEKMAQTILKQVHPNSNAATTTCSSSEQEDFEGTTTTTSSFVSTNHSTPSSSSHESHEQMDTKSMVQTSSSTAEGGAPLTPTSATNQHNDRPSFISSKPLSIHSPSFEPPPHVLQQTIRQERALLQQVDSPLTDEFKTSVARLRGLPWTSTIRDIAEFFSEFKLAKRDPSLTNLEEQIPVECSSPVQSSAPTYEAHPQQQQQQNTETQPTMMSSMKRPSHRMTQQKSNFGSYLNNGSSTHNNSRAVSSLPTTTPKQTSPSAIVPSQPTYADILKGVSVPSSTTSNSTNNGSSANSSSGVHTSSSPSSSSFQPASFANHSSYSPTTSTTPQQVSSHYVNNHEIHSHMNELTSMGSSSPSSPQPTAGQSPARQYTLPIELVKELDILLMLNYYGKSTGEAYVRFESDEELERARKTMDKKNLGNRYIEIFKSTVDEMEHSRKVLERNLKNLNNSKILKMRNVPFSATEEEIETFFSGLTIATAPLYRQNHHHYVGMNSSSSSSPNSNSSSSRGSTSEETNMVGDDGSHSSQSSGADESKTESPQEHHDNQETLSQQTSMPTRRKIFFVINPMTGKRTGEVFVEFMSHEQMVQASKRNKEKIRNRYIELFHSSISELRASQYYIQQHQQYYQTKPQHHQYLTNYNYYQRPAMRNNYYQTNRNSTMNGGHAIASSNNELKPTTSVESSSSFIVKIEGLPTDFEEDQIADWLNGLNIADAGIHLIFGEDEHSTGEAFIEFDDEESLTRALERDQTTITSTEENHETGEPLNEMTYTVRVLKSDRAEMLAVCGIEEETNQEDGDMQEEEGAIPVQETQSNDNTLEASSGDASQQEQPHEQHQTTRRFNNPYYRKNPYNRRGNYGSYNPAYTGVGGYYHPMMFMMQQAQYSYNNGNNYHVYGLDQFMNSSNGMASSSSQQPFKYKLFEHPERTLKMRGLPFTATEKDIMEFFNGYDFEDDSIRFKMDFKRNRQTGICYIRFRTKSEAERAANERNRCNIGDRYIELFTIVPKT